jgi:hypothetical protein
MNAHGWKTYLAAGALAVTGAADILANGQTGQGIKEIIAALALVGIRGGFAKLIEAFASK